MSYLTFPLSSASIEHTTDTTLALMGGDNDTVKEKTQHAALFDHVDPTIITQDASATIEEKKQKLANRRRTKAVKQDNAITIASSKPVFSPSAATSKEVAQLGTKLAIPAKKPIGTSVKMLKKSLAGVTASAYAFGRQTHKPRPIIKNKVAVGASLVPFYDPNTRRDIIADQAKVEKALPSTSPIKVSEADPKILEIDLTGAIRYINVMPGTKAHVKNVLATPEEYPNVIIKIDDTTKRPVKALVTKMELKDFEESRDVARALAAEKRKEAAKMARKRARCLKKQNA